MSRRSQTQGRSTRIRPKESKEALSDMASTTSASRLSRSGSASTSSLFVKRTTGSQPPSPLGSPSRAAITSLLREHNVHNEHRIKRWLEDQKEASHDRRTREPTRGSEPEAPSHAYLAYPQLAWGAIKNPVEEESASLDEFIVVNHEDATAEEHKSGHRKSRFPLLLNPTPPATPPSSPFSPQHAWTNSGQSTQSWRNFQLPLSRPRRPISQPIVHLHTPPQTPKKPSIFRRSAIPQSFVQPSDSPPTQEAGHEEPCFTPETPKASRLRPFRARNSGPPPPSYHPVFTPPRPSLSSNSTIVDESVRSSTKRFPRFSLSLSRASSAETPCASDISGDFAQRSQHSLLSNAFTSRTTLLSSTHVPMTPSKLGSSSSVGLSNSSLPHVMKSSLSKKTSRILQEIANKSSSLSLSPGKSNLLNVPGVRRKKLVVSGVPPDDADALDGVRKWCETFGEIRHITKIPNGDLHVDFKKSEVADSVCRLRARVFISGVGSVSLSWYTGKKPL
ncbi:hypothetical protein BD410DRAFT_835477 [Rickenella mellea]|uniref:RRM domain-containing protein n=1 Tax=Rickenella mellea TaxID=50990 RepID=A0A4Y7QMX9_9AGAM|nr:hypothetical protein BD410DRAFT_835477 [Rickenella mellea]